MEDLLKSQIIHLIKDRKNKISLLKDIYNCRFSRYRDKR